MGIKRYKPVTPTQRYKSSLTFDEITTDKPYKKLCVGKKESAGRGAKGQISVRRTLHQLHNRDVIIREPKTSKSRRMIALSPSTVIVLREHRMD